MKRQRTAGGSFTGGSGDIKPQILTLTTGIALAPNDYVVNRQGLPVSRFGTAKNKATVIEFLWVDWYLNIENLADSSDTEFGFLTTNTSRIDGDPVTTIFMAEDIDDPRTIAYAASSTGFVTSGGFHKFVPIRVNLSDANGNGILIATDQIYIVGGGIAQTVAGSVIAKVGYRTVVVGLQEYVGIVQSQQ